MLYAQGKWPRRREEKRRIAVTEGRGREKKGKKGENMRKPREYWKERERMN